MQSKWGDEHVPEQKTTAIRKTTILSIAHVYRSVKCFVCIYMPLSLTLSPWLVGCGNVHLQLHIEDPQYYHVCANNAWA